MAHPAPASRARTRLVSLALALVLSGAPARAQTAPAPGPFDVGKSVVEADIGGTVLKLYAYKPADHSGEGFILLLHGASRAAEAYRDDAAGMAERFRTLVVVPPFDAARFPSRLYQFGGVFREDGTIADAEERTFAYVPKLVAHIRAREASPNLPYEILGFSAGAQFLCRMAAFLDTDAERLVVMSPGSSMFPARDLEYGRG